MKRLLCLLGVLALPGCVSPVATTSQPVAWKQRPATSSCQVPVDDTSRDDSTDRCTKQPVQAAAEPAPSGSALFGAMLMGGLVHAAIDAATHASYGYPGNYQPASGFPFAPNYAAPSARQMLPVARLPAPVYQTAKAGS